MAREIDDKKKRKVLRKLRKAAERAEAEGGPGLSDWEREFVDEVEARIETFGSAFADPEKGNLDDPLSALQARKLKEIDKKSRGKGSSGFRQRTSFKKKPSTHGFTPRSRDIHEDVEVAENTDPPRAEPPRLISNTDKQAVPRRTSHRGGPQQSPRPHLRLVRKTETDT